jgi:hypothetical protein
MGSGAAATPARHRWQRIKPFRHIAGVNTAYDAMNNRAIADTFFSYLHLLVLQPAGARRVKRPGGFGLGAPEWLEARPQ